ncbi:MAG: putative response-associated peptidase [Marmoricola sp.]|nr:putative response-associated peptidase [Marmoricola sp.]
MCGRYASSMDPEDIVEEFEIHTAVPDLPRIPADYNVAPTKEIYAVLERPPKRESDGEPAQPAVRQLRVLSWGLVPSWAKDPKVGSRMINARVETVAEKPSFRKAFGQRRAILPADGYYEWYVTDELTPSGKPKKQPFFIRPKGSSMLAMAGLYELWRDPERAADDPLRWKWSATVITTTATDELGRIHDRMPMMLTPDAYDAWLDPAPRPAEELLALLRPAAPGLLEAFPVSTLVSNVANNGPELLTPLPVEGLV